MWSTQEGQSDRQIVSQGRRKAIQFKNREFSNIFCSFSRIQNGTITKDIPGKYCNSMSKPNPASRIREICGYEDFLPNATDQSGG